LSQARECDYVCVQAFIEPDPRERSPHSRSRRQAAPPQPARRDARLTARVTCHSTGQLHKGGPNTGLFLQIVDDPGDEIPIPGKAFGFRR